MKKIIATAALGAALFAGALASTAPASAQTDDEDSFLTALDNHEIRYTDADDAIALGHGVQADFKGRAPGAVGTEIDNKTVLTRAQALNFVGSRWSRCAGSPLLVCPTPRESAIFRHFKLESATQNWNLQRCRFRASVADARSPTWRDAELPSKWRKRFSGFRGGS
jgi:uncharacterized protein DUF732